MLGTPEVAPPVGPVRLRFNDSTASGAKSLMMLTWKNLAAALPGTPVQDPTRSEIVATADGRVVAGSVADAHRTVTAEDALDRDRGYESRLAATVGGRRELQAAGVGARDGEERIQIGCTPGDLLGASILG